MTRLAAVLTLILLAIPARADAVVSPTCLSYDEFGTVYLGEPFAHFKARTVPDVGAFWHGPHSRDLVACNSHALGRFWWLDGDTNHGIAAWAWLNCPPNDVCVETEHHGIADPTD